MLTNYLTIAIRSLLKHKSNTFISMFGLLAGISSAMVLALYAYQELTFDSWHDKNDNVFLVYKDRVTPTGIQSTYATWVPMLDALKDEYQDVKEGSRMFRQQGFLTIDNKQLSEEVTFADASLFKVFNLPTEQGDGYDILQNKSHTILSPETAEQFFGRTDPIGKPLRLSLNGKLFELTVAAVFKHIPANSSIRPGMLISIENALSHGYNRPNGTKHSWTRLFQQKTLPMLRNWKNFFLRSFENITIRKWRNDLSTGCCRFGSIITSLRGLIALLTPCCVWHS
ncbi:MAG TPA: ABC transporter permease [Chryseolinea sp.]